MNTDCFVDTSGFFALLNPDDPNHRQALDYNGKASKNRWRSFTTEWVVGETCTLLKARGKPHLVPSFLSRLSRTTALSVFHVTSDHFQEAQNFLLKHNDQSFSFTDCTSFVLMREKSIRRALTADHHFRSAGFDPFLT